MPRKAREVPWLDTRGGVYYAFWYDAKARRTQRCSLRTEDPIEATRLFAAFLTDGGSLYNGDQSSGLSAGKALDDYFSEHVRLKVVDQGRAELNITHLKKFFDLTDVASIDIPMCRSYVDARKSGLIGAKRRNGDPYIPGDGTLRRELGTLVAAVNHAVKWKRLSRNDVPPIEFPERPPAKQLWLYPDEFERLLQAAPLDTRAGGFIRLAYYTAARRRSIEQLEIFQVSLERNRINLAKAGERTTKKRRPTVPIDPALRPALIHWLKTTDTNFVLRNSYNITSAFQTVLKYADMLMLPERDGRPAGRPTPHTLRHTRATHLLQAGKSPWAVASLLGDTVTTVINNYGHHCPSHLEEVMGASEEDILL